VNLLIGGVFLYAEKNFSAVGCVVAEGATHMMINYPQLRRLEISKQSLSARG
jgi:hypothetical protein